MDEARLIELLESEHTFPGTYQFKAIGEMAGGFVERVLLAVEEEVSGASEIDHDIRETASGKYVSVTLDVAVQSAAHVLRIYERIRCVEGLRMTL